MNLYSQYNFTVVHIAKLLHVTELFIAFIDVYNCCKVFDFPESVTYNQTFKKTTILQLLLQFTCILYTYLCVHILYGLFKLTPENMIEENSTDGIQELVLGQTDNSVILKLAI